VSRTASSGYRQRLADVKTQLRAARDDLHEASAATATARERLVAVGGATDVSSPEFLAAEAAMRRENEIKGQIDVLREAQMDLLKVMSGATQNGAPSYSFLNDPQAVGQLAALANSSAPIGRVNLGQYMSAEEWCGLIGSGLDAPSKLAAFTDNAPSLRNDQRQFGITPQLRRPLRFLDVVEAVPVTSKTHDYVREEGSLDGAAETPEGMVKPEIGATYTDQQARVETIAGWTKVLKQQLDDVDALAGAIGDRASYMVMRRLEGQVIAGDGLGVNLQGLINTTGIANVTFDAAQLAADQVLEGIVDVILSGAEPNVVCLSVRDWANMLKVKATGSGEYLSGGAFGAISRVLWDVAVVPVESLAVGTALVGDTRGSMRILVREGVNVIISDADSDDLIRNRATVLAEGRFGVEVFQPAAWCAVDLAA